MTMVNSECDLVFQEFLVGLSFVDYLCVTITLPSTKAVTEIPNILVPNQGISSYSNITFVYPPKPNGTHVSSGVET
jgi:hypothetical protein